MIAGGRSSEADVSLARQIMINRKNRDRWKQERFV